MITIKGVTQSMINIMRSLMGGDVITTVNSYDTPSLQAITLSDDVMLSAHGKGFIVLNRNGDIVVLTNDDYVEITIS